MTGRWFLHKYCHVDYAYRTNGKAGRKSGSMIA